MAKKVSAVITAPNSEPYRAYFQLDDNLVWIWTKNTNYGGIYASRYNDGKFSRDWVRACFLPDVTVEF